MTNKNGAAKKPVTNAKGGANKKAGGMKPAKITPK